MTEKRKKSRFTVALDSELWYQLGIRVAELSAKEGRPVSKWGYLEDALREKLERDKDK